ncbi:Protein of unknown function [Chryseolinea serpens]|uniref:DUF3592 domain-containing protein n=1 Tax=Chryseolinea serpens TaxID=947013 RepID=A0A1M5UER7_9BACT|nr:DUF3592 domain-containing protein [Chryseolinea serpens]SHH61153.1 Protein of unknown function [Chryseolinea serpens]
MSRSVLLVPLTNAQQDVAAIFFFLMAMAFIYFSTARLLKVSRFLKNARTTMGVVVKTSAYPSDEEGSFYCPVVRFQTDKQEWITQRVGSFIPQALPEGEEIEIMYDPEDSSQVEIYSRRLIFIPVGCLAFGVMVFVMMLSAVS